MLVVDDSLNFPFESKDTSDRDIGRNNIGKGFTTRNVINTFVGKVKFAFEEGFPLRTRETTSGRSTMGKDLIEARLGRNGEREFNCPSAMAGYR